MLIGCAPQGTKLLSLGAVSESGVPSSYPVAEEIDVVPGNVFSLVFDQAVSPKLLTEIVLSGEVNPMIEGKKVEFVIPEYDLLITLPKSITSEYRQIQLTLWDVAMANAEIERLYPCSGLHTVTAFLTGYPEIKLHNEGGILVRPNDEVTFQAGCPLDKGLVSEAIEACWGDVDYSLTWIDNSTFTLSSTQPEWRKLEIGLTDHGGRIFNNGLFIWFEIVEPSVVKSIDLSWYWSRGRHEQ